MRDLAVARALGFTPRQVAAAVRWQGLVSAAAGAEVGLVAGVIAGRVVWTNLADDIGAVVAVRVPVWTIPAVVAVRLVVTLAATWWPARRARLLRPAQVLRAE